MMRSRPKSRRVRRGIANRVSLIGLIFTGVMPFATGCSATSSIEVQSPPLSLAAYDRLVVDVTVGPSTAVDKPVMDQLSGSLVARLRQGQKFAKVNSSSATVETQFDVRLAVLLTSVRDVNTQERFWIGMLSGPGAINAQLQLVDTRTNAVLGSAMAHAESSNGPVIGTQGTTREAVEEVVKKIVTFVEQAK